MYIYVFVHSWMFAMNKMGALTSNTCRYACFNAFPAFSEVFQNFSLESSGSHTFLWPSNPGGQVL